MNIERIKQKAISGLRTQKTNISISFSDIEDENFKKYKYGEITLIEFINSVSDVSPYKIVETYGDKFLIIDRDQELPPHYFLDPNIIKDILTDGSKPKFIEAYPELKDHVENVYQEINSAGCVGCARSSKLKALVQQMMFLDNKNRDLSAIEPILGSKFISALKSYPRLKGSAPLPDLRANEEKDSNKTVETETETETGQFVEIWDGPRASCVECCLKHIGTAIVLLEEAANGYPAHRWLAAGELNEAANEMLRSHPDVAREIRAMRHAVTKHPKKSPDLMDLLYKLDRKFFS